MKCFDGLKSAIRQMLCDGDGQISAIRVTLLSTAALILAKALAFNVMALIQSKGMVGFDTNDVALLGLVVGSKVIQSFAERKAGQ